MSIPRAFITAALAALLSSAQVVSVTPPRDDAVAVLVMDPAPPLGTSTPDKIRTPARAPSPMGDASGGRRDVRERVQ